MSPRLRRPSKATTFSVLMVAAGLLSLMPRAWTNWAKGVVGPLDWLLRPAAVAARGIDRSVDALSDPPLSAADARRLAVENEELRRQIGHQELRLGEVQRRFDELSGVRGQLPDRNTRIIIAPVIAPGDADRRRQTIQIGKGEAHGVHVGWWVAAGVPPDEWAEGDTGRQALSRQWLIGTVSETKPYSSRVILTTDPLFRSSVRPARELADGTWQPAEEDWILLGQGGGKALISQSQRNYYQEGYRLVLAPISRTLSNRFVLGRIVDARPVASAPNFFDLDVRPWADVRRVAWVYVIAVEE